jgi:hypothetical protein
LNEFRRRGLSVALGLDDCSLNDDRSILQEMRVALKVHRTPGMDDSVPTACDVLQMATEHGAHTTPYGSRSAADELSSSHGVRAFGIAADAFEPASSDQTPDSPGRPRKANRLSNCDLGSSIRNAPCESEASFHTFDGSGSVGVQRERQGRAAGQD